MIQAIVVDDERPSADKMEKLLKSSGIVEVKEKFTKPREALAYLNRTKVDAVFLDIEMPEIDGFELANQMLDHQRWLAIVFVTAYSEYAVEAFRLNALDYLMKPVHKERLKETLERIVKEKNIPLKQPKLQVHCFDRFRASTGSGEIKFRTKKAEELLAYFIDHWRTAVSRSEIIDQLWPDHEGDRAVSNFNTTLYYLRRELSKSGVDTSIEHIKGTYRLKTDLIDCDYHRFTAFLNNSSPINDTNISEYGKTALLYTGDYLSSNEYQWAIRKQTLLKEKYIQLILHMTDHFTSTGKYKQVIEILIAGLKHEPMHTEMNYRLIRTFLEIKDRVSAIKYYNIYQRNLERELGIEPDEIFNKLIQ